MKLSDLLRWGVKKTDADVPPPAPSPRERRQALCGGSGSLYWISESGEPQRARVAFLEESADPDGLRLRTPKAPSDGVICWAVPEGGQAFPCQVHRIEKLDQGAFVDVSLGLQERAVPGHGGAHLQWVDDDRVVHTLPATFRNSGQALIEVGLQSNVPARRLVLLEGRNYSCLAVCRGGRPDGSRFLLVVEAASEAFASSAAAA